MYRTGLDVLYTPSSPYAIPSSQYLHKTAEPRHQIIIITIITVIAWQASVYMCEYGSAS